MPATLIQPWISMPSETDGPNTRYLTIGLTKGMSKLVDAYIRSQRRPGSKEMSKGEAIRRLLVSGLIREGFLREEDADDPPHEPPPLS